jgi:glutathione peroxidase
MKLSFLTLLLGTFTLVQGFTMSSAHAEPPQSLNFKVKTLTGEDADLSQYAGKVILVVNVASKCGNTPQYAGLQELYDKHKGDGLVVLGFPCNQFGGQEPGSAKDIGEFCEATYGVKFPMFEKIDVNGANAHPFYQYLTSYSGNGIQPGPVKWNFEKFVIGRNGEVVARIGARVKPDNKDVTEVLTKELAKKQ